MSEQNKNPETEPETTGHEWDGIKEYNNPLPRWWLNVFYITCIWAVGYWIFMPAIPYWTPTDGWTYTEGIRELSQRDKVAGEIAEVNAERAAHRDEIAGLTLAQVRESPELFEIALAGGASAFRDNCAGCHGSGAQGFIGFPNLNDDDWIWGGKLSDIEFTIRHGIRWDEDADTRFNEMPKYLADGFLSRDEVAAVTEYVLSLSGQEHDQAALAQGKELFDRECISCHGENGEGILEMGAPNLTDQIWLFPSDRAGIYETIAYSRNGVMPAWQGRLDEGTIKELALFVHSLGGGVEE